MSRSTTCECAKSFGVLVAGLLLLVSAAAPVAGQSAQRGRLEGIVRDTEGEPLPGVTVTATSTALQGQRRTATEAGGGYVLRDLPRGDYAVRFESAPPYEVPVSLERERGLTLLLKRDGRKVFHARRPHEVAHRTCELPEAPSPAAPEPGLLWEELPARIP